MPNCTEPGIVAVLCISENYKAPQNVMMKVFFSENGLRNTSMVSAL